MKFLVSNVGSTSLKFKLYDMPGETLLCEARMESIGSAGDAAYWYRNALTGAEARQTDMAIPDYTAGIHLFLDSLLGAETGVLTAIGQLDGVVFKTVLAKGYYGVHELTQPVLTAMEEYLFVAPVHNAAYLEAIKVFRTLLPDISMIGAFETAFHTTVPLARRLYAIPYEWYEKYGIMKLGYHGASHRYIAQTLDARHGGSRRSISCHLGGSSSLCAIRDGESVDTSFGFSLQTGIPHSSRCGDADPYIFPFLLSTGMALDDIHRGMSKNGGLLGISGVSGDLRKIERAAADGDARAELAIAMLVEAILHYIGSFYMTLGGLDNLVFTAGIGENSPTVRARVCERLRHIGVELDPERNAAGKGKRHISTDASPVRVLVIPTDEELVLARQAVAFREGR